MEPKCGTWRHNGGRLGDITEAGRLVLRGLEVILQILRLGDHFCGDHGASAPPPSYHSGSETLEVIYTTNYTMAGKTLYLYYRGSEFPTNETATVALWRGHKVYTTAEQCTLRHRIYDGGKPTLEKM